ncbi:hypothetical protein BZARG_3008 [Bizionia argentinensis JUB59]|uniref:Uncharacterized protein n=1 Tax=Bizionia argentinensis JUB59 TaxID=1046627 RepID=G2EFY8_9FLAO|nr:hypothetical protein BZARG_3008 [Bizionia argentinensis JUB59]
MNRFGAILLFYKPYVLWSLGVTLFLISVDSDFIVICAAKLFLLTFLWYFLSETTAKRKLIFYKNLGISTLKLFSVLYIIDILITSLFFKVFNVFI